MRFHQLRDVKWFGHLTVIGATLGPSALIKSIRREGCKRKIHKYTRAETETFGKFLKKKNWDSVLFKPCKSQFVSIDRYVSAKGVCVLVSSCMLFNIHTLMHACTPACSQAWSVLIDLFTAQPRHLRNECLTWGPKTLRGWRQESFIYLFNAVLTCCYSSE